MTSRLVALCFDANDPVRLARFWAAALRWEVVDRTGELVDHGDVDWTVMADPDGHEFCVTEDP